MSLAAFLWLLSSGEPGHVRHCEAFEFTDANELVCLDTGLTYDEDHYALHHDRDDGEIVRVEVWR